MPVPQPMKRTLGSVAERANESYDIVTEENAAPKLPEASQEQTASVKEKKEAKSTKASKAKKTKGSGYKIGPAPVDGTKISVTMSVEERLNFSTSCTRLARQEGGRSITLREFFLRAGYAYQLNTFTCENPSCSISFSLHPNHNGELPEDPKACPCCGGKISHLQLT